MSVDKDERESQTKIPKTEKNNSTDYNEVKKTYFQKFITEKTHDDNMQALKYFNKLHQKIIRLQNKTNYNKNDQRLNLLMVFSKICMWGVLLVKGYLENLHYPIEIMKTFGLSEQDTVSFLNYASQYQRISFLTLFMFEVENLLGALRNEFVKSDDRKIGYENICKQLLTEINMENDEEIISALLCPSYIRNTMHSNGIHTKELKKFLIKGKVFEFKQNEYVEAEWIRICFLLDALIDVVGEILLHPKIKEISFIGRNI